jgi:predicted ATPase
VDSASGSIRTPDQRLRVFVSSTLKELAPERKAARAAIERLHLAPVMFELGARPHPPRDLYRAYLQQSDVFVGLYWERYGWVAPGEEVSGLEDEYNLAPDLPKLIYIKETTGAREERLTALLDRVRSDDTASFKYFFTARELGSLLEGDLATLLAERFDQSRAAARTAPVEPTGQPHTAGTTLPAPLTELIGREREVETVAGMLRRDGARLVTLTGPGGIGKSRLAIEAATRLTDDFSGGVVFVDLAPVHDPGLVINAVAEALGVRDTGDAPLVDKVGTAVRDRRLLLVIDNVEQVVGAATVLTSLLASAPRLAMLLTSRTLLRVSAERSFEVGPLALPRLGRDLTVEEVAAAPSVALFVDRVHAVKPDFELTAANAEAVARICAALDGVPLALELAAARVRVLPPAAMLERLGLRLPLLSGGARDLPERQQTLRRTIEWSIELLDDDERELLATLGVFEGGFSLEAAEAVAPGEGLDTVTSLGILVDNSLVREQDRGGRSHFSMLATVREYAREQLAAAGLLDEALDRHAAFYESLGRRVELELEGARQGELVAMLADDKDNLRAAVRYLIDGGRHERAAAFAWTLYLYWWVGGLLGEVRSWMEEVLASGAPLPGLTRAIALYFSRAITFWQDNNELVVSGLTESAELFAANHDASGEALARVSLALARLASETPDAVEADEQLESSLTLFRESGDIWGESMALVTLGRVALVQGKVHASCNRFEESLAIARAHGDQLGESIALHHLGWARLLSGEVDAAGRCFERSLRIGAALGHDEGVAYGLEGLVAVAATAGDVHRAGRLLGAAERLREETGLYNALAFSFHQGLVDGILAGPLAADFEAARAEGHRLGVTEATAEALGGGTSGDTSGDAGVGAAGAAGAA